MDTQVLEQASDELGDVQASEMEGHTVSVLPAEANDTADDEKEEKDDNDSAKKWRKSDKEWQETVEKAKKVEDIEKKMAAIAKALGVEPEKNAPKEDVTEQLIREVDSLKMDKAAAEWEKDNPIVATAEYKDEWKKIKEQKIHLVKSGDLTFDELFAIIRKSTKPTTTKRDYKHQEIGIGSAPIPSKTVVNGQAIDPDIYQQMKAMGYTDKEIYAS